MSLEDARMRGRLVGVIAVAVEHPGGDGAEVVDEHPDLEAVIARQDVVEERRLP